MKIKQLIMCLLIVASTSLYTFPGINYSINSLHKDLSKICKKYVQIEEAIANRVTPYTEPLWKKRSTLITQIRDLQLIRTNVEKQDKESTTSQSNLSAAEIRGTNQRTFFETLKTYLPTKKTVSTTGKLIGIDCALIGGITLQYAPRIALFGLGLYIYGFSQEKSIKYALIVGAGCAVTHGYSQRNIIPFWYD